MVSIRRLHINRAKRKTAYYTYAYKNSKYGSDWVNHIDEGLVNLKHITWEAYKYNVDVRGLGFKK